MSGFLGEGEEGCKSMKTFVRAWFGVEEGVVLVVYFPFLFMSNL